MKNLQLFLPGLIARRSLCYASRFDLRAPCLCSFWSARERIELGDDHPP